MTRLLVTAAVFATLLPGAVAEEKFRLRYFYDRDDSELKILQMQFVNAKRAVAIGVLTENDRVKGALVVSDDGGETWEVQPFKEIPRAMHFIESEIGWIATEKGVWRSEEGGRTWQKVKSQKGLLAIRFLDANTGFAAGVPKLFLSTIDGGRKWTPVPEGEKPETTADNTAYSVITFLDGKSGIVSGFSVPPTRRRSALPDWMDPELAKYRRQRPTVLVLFETSDSGKTWKHQTSSVFGRVAQISLAPSATGLAVMQFDNEFPWPSEVYRLMIGTGKSERVYREKTDLVTDALVTKGGTAYLAAIQQATAVRGTPIPGKVKILTAEGPAYSRWEPLPVDYRATGLDVSLCQSPDGTIWTVTSGGMILSRAP